MANARPPAPNPTIRITRPPVPDAEKRYLTQLDVALETAGDRLTPALRAQIEQEFGAYLGQTGHPCLVANRLDDLLCRACFADHLMPEARRLFGRASVGHYRESILGRVMLAAIPIMGMERIVRLIPRSFAATTNYGTRVATEIGPRHWRCEFEDEIMYPEIIQGVLEGIGELARVPGLQITCTPRGPAHFAFDITWQAR
ncbi:MAG TPA: DUF2378 family protein [Chloroflexia bacterium]